MQQITFLFENNSYNHNEFIVTKANQFALTTMQEWPNKTWGVMPYKNTLILRGPKSSGKTYMAKKWALLSQAHFIKSAHELTENILNHYKAFVIEDIERKWYEEKLLHHFNAINEQGKYLLMTTSDLPVFKLPDLESRIKALNIIDIHEPDDEMMSLLIFKLFSNYSITIDKDIIHYLMKNLAREFPEIIKAVQKINDYSAEQKKKITIQLVKNALDT